MFYVQENLNIARFKSFANMFESLKLALKYVKRTLSGKYILREVQYW